MIPEKGKNIYKKMETERARGEKRGKNNDKQRRPEKEEGPMERERVSGKDKRERQCKLQTFTSGKKVLTNTTKQNKRM